MDRLKVAIVGGGAAGFFAAIQVKENYPDADVRIFEKSSKVLSKVKVSGGGRCNLAHYDIDIEELSKAYPRGRRFLKRAFYTFSALDTMQWFETRNVPLVVQPDQCVFPKSQQSQSVIDVFLQETSRLGIHIKTGFGVQELISKDHKLKLIFSKGQPPQLFHKVIIAIGGMPKRKNLDWLATLGHTIENPVPSLFTFNMPDESITRLMGIVVQKTQVTIRGSKFHAAGPLLITDWGMSGPAILKLSSVAARYLSEKEYHFQIQVNWVDQRNNERVATALYNIIATHPNKMLLSVKPFALPERLWEFLLNKMEMSSSKKWNELGKKGVSKIVQFLTNDPYKVQGKTTFKEEFVTCGGVSLKSIEPNTMQSKVVKNLYFAGEILDMDGITGGYNFQAAWTTGFIAGKLK